MPSENEITYGYDRHVRSWCIIVHRNGYEAESHYLATKEGCLRWVNELKEEYKGYEVRKIKAY